MAVDLYDGNLLSRVLMHHQSSLWAPRDKVHIDRVSLCISFIYTNTTIYTQPILSQHTSTTTHAPLYNPHCYTQLHSVYTTADQSQFRLLIGYSCVLSGSPCITQVFPLQWSVQCILLGTKSGSWSFQILLRPWHKQLRCKWSFHIWTTKSSSIWICTSFM